MFSIRMEHQPIKPGFNFYKLNDPFNGGFIFKSNWINFQIRYSKFWKRFVIKTFPQYNDR